ncbi:MAG: Peptide deformylase [Chlamydiia bacterium]|nr:Peptide deformylase [Chlamydiia bacterium]
MIREVVLYGNPVLQTKGEKVTSFDKELCSLVDDIIDTNRAHNGVGLSAQQIGVNKQVFVTVAHPQDSPDGDLVIAEPTVFINPEITKYYPDKIYLTEGCISIPGIWEDLKRSYMIDIKAYDINGNPFEEIGVVGWRARNLQHEFDHTQGVLFIEYFSKSMLKYHRRTLRNIQNRSKNEGAVPKRGPRIPFSDDNNQSLRNL